MYQTSGLRVGLFAALVACFWTPILAHAVPAAQSGPQLVVQMGHTASVWGVAFSPDGALLASGSADQTVKLWRPSTGELVRTLEGHRGLVSSVAFSPDGRMLASGSMDNTIRLWDPRSGNLLRTLTGHTQQVMAIAFSPSGKWLASASQDGTLRVWNPFTGRPVRVIAGHVGLLRAIAVSPDGRLLATAGNDLPRPEIVLYEVATGRRIRVMVPPASAVGSFSLASSLAFSPDGKRLACGCDEGVEVWDDGGGTLRTVLTTGGSDIKSVAWSRNGRLLAADSGKEQIMIWDGRTYHLLRTLRGHRDLVDAVAFTPDSAGLASGSYDGSIRIWDVTRGTKLSAVPGNGCLCESMAMAPDGTTLATTDPGTGIHVWRLSADAASVQRRLIALRGARPGQVVISPDGRQIAASQVRTVQVLDYHTGRLERTLPVADDPIEAITFSRRESLLAAAESRGRITLWNTLIGRRVQVLPEPPEFYFLSSLTFTRDERLAAGARFSPGNTFAAELLLWNCRTGKLLRPVTLSTGSIGVDAVAAAPAADLLAVTFAVEPHAAAPQGVISVSGLKPYAAVAVLDHGGSHVLWRRQYEGASGSGLAFSPVGGILASTSGNGQIRLWNAINGALVRTLPGHHGAAVQVAFAPNGRLLATSGQDGAVKLWNAADGRLLATILALPDSGDHGTSDWIVFTPDGYFDCSPGADHFIRWRVGDKLYPAESFAARFHRKDRVLRQIAVVSDGAR